MTTPLYDEPLVTLPVLGRRVPGRGGKDSISPRTMSRWIMRGALAAEGNRVYLEAIRAPGGWRTSEAALVRFLDALTVAARPKCHPEPSRSPAVRTRASEAAEAELKKIGA